MIVVNGLKTCDACRKALRALKDAQKDAAMRDFRADPPSESELRDWLDRLGPDLLNTRSATWRGLSEDARRMDPVALMAAHPTVIKRPVITDGDDVHLGWTEAARAALYART